MLTALGSPRGLSFRQPDGPAENVMMKTLVSLCGAAVLIAGCGQRDPVPPPADASASATPSTPPVTPPTTTGAIVQLAPTQGNSVRGSLTLSAEGNDVRLSGTVEGLAPNGEFGFHIHENGDCSAPDASSAGGHFNPANAPHGNPTGSAHHAGDMPNIKSDTQGMAQVDATARGVTLNSGADSDVAGKAVVVHAKADDYTSQPAGDAGARIACGVIG
jgi:Cu-Zn family superoxide dismutase